MRVIEDPRLFEYSQKAELETRNNANKVPIRYKVFIMGRAGALLPPPESYEDKVVSVLDDYSQSPTFVGILAKGTIVFVDTTRRTIEYSTDNSVGQSASTSNQPNSAGGAFANPTQQPKGPVTVDQIPEDVTEGDAYINGDGPTKIKLKTIVSYSTQRMRADAADSFNQMCKAAAADNIKLVANSGFRTQADQIRIYDDRFVNKHPYPQASFKTPKAQRVKNILTPNGMSKGTAAYPGFSNHQGGTAVDIEVVTTGAGTRYEVAALDERFKWLSKNADKYGFNNAEGFSVNEPWHWVYKGLPAQSAEIAESQKDGTNP